MNKKLLIATYGIGVWALPFVVGMALFSLQENYHELFDAAMVFMLVLATILFSAMYQKKPGSSSMNSMIVIGFIWLGICLLIDVPLFLHVFQGMLLMFLLGSDVFINYRVRWKEVTA